MITAACLTSGIDLPTLSGYRLRNVVIDWSYLGFFYGTQLLPYKCIELLQLALNLTNCIIEDVNPAGFHSIPNYLKPLGYSTLRYMRLGGTPCQYSMLLIFQKARRVALGDPIPEEDTNKYLKVIESGTQLSIDDLQHSRDLIEIWRKHYTAAKISGRLASQDRTA
ncbi:hypothetical protein CPB83DRAFT_838090 [Crepidotus variabilis]|uniref:Uncharacterized protein n=1 Tax=Crepidotus variabilis TaxID=179855 RepID=A0A9P6E9Z0_9AGAR|nr:hypothetical protein CPB83DRAFT_838090 [Crepidotus variabilis]